MNFGLFVVEHPLGPEGSGAGFDVEKLAGVDEGRVQLRLEQGGRQVAPKRRRRRRRVAVQIVLEDDQAKAGKGRHFFAFAPKHGMTVAQSDSLTLF